MSIPETSTETLERKQALLFAPVHKRAFGTATGVTFAAIIFLATAYAVVRSDAPPILYSVHFLIPAHGVSWGGALLGSISGGFAFFVAGWFLAFVRNATLAGLIWLARTKAELEQARDFLDHI